MRRFKTSKDVEISEWQEVTMEEWDKLMTSQREILKLSDGSIVFVKKV